MKSKIFTEETVKQLVINSNAMFSRDDLTTKKDRFYSDLAVE